MIKIIYLKKRGVAWKNYIRYAITQNPTKEFVRQQIIEFENHVKKVVYLLHDNATYFTLNYLSYSIKEVRISIRASDMNTITERFIRNTRHEALGYLSSANPIWKRLATSQNRVLHSRSVMAA